MTCRRENFVNKNTPTFLQPYLLNHRPEFEKKYTKRLAPTHRTRFWSTGAQIPGFESFGISGFRDLCTVS